MRIESFRVVPAVPERLAGLREIAYNLLWSWDDDLRQVFSRLDRDLWDRTYQNPVAMLGAVAQDRLEALAADESFSRTTTERSSGCTPTCASRPRGTAASRAAARRVLLGGVRHRGVPADLLRRPRRPLRPPPQERERPRRAARRRGPPVPAGVLPPVPLVRRLAAGVVLAQRLLQHAGAARVERVRRARARRGRSRRRTAIVQVWRAEVGRVPLYLLDTNVPENPRTSRT